MDNIGESAEYVEQALRKMKEDGKPIPILVIDDVQTLFDQQVVNNNVSSSLQFLALLVQWQIQGLVRPILISSQGSLVKYFERGELCIYTY